MKVILNQDIKGVGKKLQTVEVSEGYARNFLLPRNAAKLADNKNLNEAKGKIDSIKHKKDEELKKANEVKEKIEKSVIEFRMKLGENGKLFGSVTEKEIANKINEKFDMSLDKKKIVIDYPIKELGIHSAKIKLHEGVVAKQKISVVKL